jgi:hypothetical protein
MTKDQISAIKCAYNDLVGALQARNQLDIEVHDWDAHYLTIVELENAFKFIEPVDDGSL